MSFEMDGFFSPEIETFRQFALNAHFIRVHRGFQSALILAERGLIPEARVVLRSAVEGAIAINALAKDEGFVDQMVGAHHRSQRTLARVQINKFAALARRRHRNYERGDCNR